MIARAAAVLLIAVGLVLPEAAASGGDGSPLDAARADLEALGDRAGEPQLRELSYRFRRIADAARDPQSSADALWLSAEKTSQYLSITRSDGHAEC